MKRLSHKLFIGVLLVLLLNLVLVLVFNTLFLEDYYLRHKQRELGDAYYGMRDVYSLGDSDAVWDAVLDLEEKNIRVFLYGSRTFAAAAGETFLLLYATGLRENETYFYIDELLEGITLSEWNIRVTDNRYILYLNEQLGSQDHALVEGLQTSAQNALTKEQLTMFGRLGDGASVLLQIPLEAVQESAKLATNFSLLAGVIALVAGLIVTLVFSVMFTRPIRQITAVAGNIARLDFTRRVPKHSRDEIGELGQSVNSIAQSLEQYTDEINEKNRQLKRDIEERMLSEQSQKLLVSNISHELKTPISIISGYAEGLLAGLAEDEKTRGEYCEAILEESRSMNHLITSLLRLSRLQSKTLEPRRTELDAGALARKLTASLALEAQKRKVHLKTDVPPGTLVWADEDAFEQVLRNYTVNALRHTPEDGMIRISSRVNGRNIRLEVYNSGSSVAPEDKERIWDSFYRADSARNREGGEVGLGLAIVKAHMTAHNTPFGCYNVDTGVVFYAEFAK